MLILELCEKLWKMVAATGVEPAEARLWALLESDSHCKKNDHAQNLGGLPPDWGEHGQNVSAKTWR